MNMRVNGHTTLGKKRKQFTEYALPSPPPCLPCLDGEERHGASVEQPEVVNVLEAVREGNAVPAPPHLHDASRARAVFEIGIDDANRPAWWVGGWVGEWGGVGWGGRGRARGRAIHGAAARSTADRKAGENANVEHGNRGKNKPNKGEHGGSHSDGPFVPRAPLAEVDA